MWARLWHFSTSPRKVRWEVTQPQEDPSSLYLCKIIPLPASLYPGHHQRWYAKGLFLLPDSTARQYAYKRCGHTQPCIPVGGRHIIDLAWEAKKAILRQARQCVCVLIKSGPVWPSAFISVPYSLHKSLQVRETLRTWQCEKRSCQNISVRPYAVKSLSRTLSATRTNPLPGLLLTHTEHEADVQEHYWKARAEGCSQPAPNPVQEEIQGLPAFHC